MRGPEARNLAAELQLLLLEGLLQAPTLAGVQWIFHGGTALHLAWRSPRFSEDLDFLVAVARTPEGVALAHRAAQEALSWAQGALDGAGRAVRLELRQRPQRAACEVRATAPGLGGPVRVRLDFWPAGPDGLAPYATTLKTLSGPVAVPMVHLHTPVRVATLQAAWLDKAVALLARERLKVRDLFDLWWIETHADFDPPGREAIKAALPHYQAAYRLPPADAARAAALARLDEAAGDGASRVRDGLRPWLPEAVWAHLTAADAPRAMLECAAAAVETLAETLNEVIPDGGPDHEPEF